MLKVVTREREGEQKKPTRSFSSKQEKQVAKNVGGKQVINSGATPFAKGDINLESLMLIECKTKTTPSQSISIKKDWLIKNNEEAVFMGKEFSTLAFNFGPGEKNYYILDENLFLEFLEFLKDKYSNLL